MLEAGSDAALHRNSKSLNASLPRTLKSYGGANSTLNKLGLAPPPISLPLKADNDPVSLVI